MTQLNLEAVLNAFRYVAEARDWSRYHSPKNLATAVAVEAGELLELFQWLGEEECERLREQPRQQVKIGEEAADILMYLTALCDAVGVDLADALASKIAANRERFLHADD